MRSKPLTYFIIGLLIIAICLLWLSFRSRPQSPTPLSIPNPTAPPLNVTPLHNHGEANPNLNLNYPPPQLPTALPLYNISTLESTVPTQIAATLGFSGSPEPTANNQGLIWENSQNKLIVQNSPFSISFNPLDYGSFTSPSASNLDSTQTIKNFLEKTQLIAPQLSLTSPKITYYLYGGGEPQTQNSPAAANLTAIAADYLLDGFPVIINPYVAHSVTGQVSGNNVLVSLFIYSLPQLTPSAPVPLISADDAAAKIKLNQGILIRAEPQTLSYGLSNVNFSQATILNQTIAYLYQDSQLIPAYLFQGIAPSNEKPYIDYNITYLAPAI